MWPDHPDADRLDRLLAELDVDGPTAIEDRDDGARVFFATADRRYRAARRIAELDQSVRCAPVDVPDDGWAERSQASLEPITVGTLTIAPRPLSESLGRNVIVIRPSMGFGTGHHASTRLCLALLQRVPTAGRRLLDVGTGSGVLAIAATRLGAKEAVGIDYDPDALAAAHENLELNSVGSVRLVAADLHDGAVAGAPFDVVMANLTGTLLIKEATTLAHLVRREGHLIASGFVTEETDAVVHALAKAGLVLEDRLDEQDWAGVVVRRR